MLPLEKKLVHLSEKGHIKNWSPLIGMLLTVNFVVSKVLVGYLLADEIILKNVLSRESSELQIKTLKKLANLMIGLAADILYLKF